MIKTILLSLTTLLSFSVTFAITPNVNNWELEEPIDVVLAPQERAILSAKVPATVLKVNKRMGQAFQEGEALIVLDDTLTGAAKLKAQAVLDRAKVLFKTKERLFNDKVASQFDYADAKATVEVATSELIIAEKMLQDSVIRAPYAGEVEESFIHVGETVEVGQKLMLIFNDKVLFAKFLAPYSFIGKIQLGRRIDIHINELDEDFSAKITYIGANIDASSSTIKVFADIENKEQRLRSGMTGTFRVKLPIASFPWPQWTKNATGK